MGGNSIHVYIFDSNWKELASVETAPGDTYSVTAEGSAEYNVKFECNGYLPFYLKNYGTGNLLVGTGESIDTVTLVPGDTTYNTGCNNQWSDDVINLEDSAYVQSCIGATCGDSNYNPTMDADGDGIINDADFTTFCSFYNGLEGDNAPAPLSYAIQCVDINRDSVINETDYKIASEILNGEIDSTPYLLYDFADGDGIFTANDLATIRLYINDVRVENSEAFIYNHEMTGDEYVNSDDLINGTANLNAARQKRDRSSNYYEYMDVNDDGIIDDYDITWFRNAMPTGGSLGSNEKTKVNLTLHGNSYFTGDYNLIDTNLNLNGYALNVKENMSFGTNTPSLWTAANLNGTYGATLDINGGQLLIQKNLDFKTASPNGWNRNAGQLMNINGGEVYIGNFFNFVLLNS
ncbi:MAG: hypothetical protein KA753_11840, partial [Paludibacter sp.]|nr:hypothetical protein [Paludibacter sp.]